jgi:HEPN domain-containing protein
MRLQLPDNLSLFLRMNKKEHIEWWKNEALRNWETAIYLLKGKQNVFALFAFHLTIEKLLKAIWVKDNIENTPPRQHDLTFIYNQTDLKLDSELYDYLPIINTWNIESRYPDYKLKIYERADINYMNQYFEKVSKLKECLLKKL